MCELFFNVIHNSAPNYQTKEDDIASNNVMNANDSLSHKYQIKD